MYFSLTRPQYENNYFAPAAMRHHQPRYTLDDFLVPALGLTPWWPSPTHSTSQWMKNIQDETTVKINNSNFEVKINVQHYKPEELDVKTVDGHVVITGKHEEKQDDHGYVSRQFTRRYALPEGVKPDSVICNLSSDGVLIVSAPLAIENAPESERKIPISFTNKPNEVSSSATAQNAVANSEDVNKEN